MILILTKFVPETNESLGSREEGGRRRRWCEGVEWGWLWWEEGEEGWVLRGWAHSLVSVCCVGSWTRVEWRPPTPFVWRNFPLSGRGSSPGLVWPQIKT